MAVNTTTEEKGIADKIVANCLPLVAALNGAGFKTKLDAYAARFDRRCGARLTVTSPTRDHWGRVLQITAHWSTGMPDKVTSRVRGARSLVLAGSNTKRIVARVQEDLAADIADENRRKEQASNSQAWFNQACIDFRGYEFPVGLRSDMDEPRHRFERLNRHRDLLTPGTYNVYLDSRAVLSGLNAAQVKALGDFLKVLPDIK